MKSFYDFYFLLITKVFSLSRATASLKTSCDLSRDVVTLFDEVKSPGTYEVKFNVETLHGASLHSGVYFYRLTAGSYNETKKLIFMK